MTVGMLRIKNEARWIERCIASILPVCSHVYVLDDHSTDGTPEICARMPRTTVYESPFQGLDESRDKQALLELIAPNIERGDWIMHVDGDEELMADDISLVRQMTTSQVCAWRFKILYLWDKPDQIRVDRWYSSFTRPSLFSYQPGMGFKSNGNGGNFHCGSAPLQLPVRNSEARLLHYGYMHAEDRIRKYHWYNAQKPVPEIEDGYRHMVVGDLFPATSSFRHAGPLELRAL